MIIFLSFFFILLLSCSLYIVDVVDTLLIIANKYLVRTNIIFDDKWFTKFFRTNNQKKSSETS